MIDMMTARRTVTTVLLASALVVGTSASAQTTTTSTDIQRLQDEVYQIATDISRLRTTDAVTAGRLQEQLDELRDEAIYLKVKLRKEGSVSRSEYADLRNRLQDLRSQARGEQPSSRGGAAYDDRPRYDERPRPTRTGGIPVGTEIDVRIQSELSSDYAQVEDRFEATTIVDLYDGDRVIIPAGSVMRGIVSSVNRASRTDRKGSLTVAFDQITVRGRNYPMRGTVTQAIESEGLKGEVGRIGAGSAVGAIIGGIIGGVKGALIGVLIGGGGTMVATEGKDVTLPAGTILRVRMDTPPEIR
jgi:hypothetical protein